MGQVDRAYNLTRKAISALTKYTRAALRRCGFFTTRPDWQARARICASCPLCTTHNRTAFCGKPFLHKVQRDEATEGCGCPVHDKARDPLEHCPRNALFEPSSRSAPGGRCDCVWCVKLGELPAHDDPASALRATPLPVLSVARSTPTELSRD